MISDRKQRDTSSLSWPSTDQPKQAIAIMDITTFVHSNRDKAFLVGDYATYRTQLSRQLLNSRRKLGCTTPKNQKFASKGPITAQDVGKNHDFARLQILTAERAWAHAMAVKNAHVEAQSDANVTGSTRKHILSRLQKASRYADQLLSVVEDKAGSKSTDEDVLEVTAYARTLSGAYEFEKQFPHRYEDSKEQKAAWNQCLVNFSEAHVIYAALLRAKKKDVFREVLAGTVDPSIRYAAYQSRLPRTVAISAVSKQHFRRSQKSLLSLVQAADPEALADDKAIAKQKGTEGDLADVPTTITWRGRTAPISEASVGQALASTTSESTRLRNSFQSALQEPKSNTQKQLAADYDPVLTSAQDTVDAVRRALAELAKEGIAESDPRMQDLRVTDLAANYDLISWRIGRNRILISSLPNTSQESQCTLDDGMHFTALPSSPPRRHRQKKSTTATTTAPNNAEPHPNTPTRSSEPKPETTPHQIARLTTRIALYDSTLQSLDSIASLRGAARDNSFQTELATQRAYFSALRCLNIGVSHKLLGRQREALALFTVASERVAELDGGALGVTEDANAGKGAVPPRLTVSIAQLQTLQKHLRGTAARQHGLVALQLHIPPLSSHAKSPEAQALRDLESSQDNDATEKKQLKLEDPLIDHLNTYPHSGTVDLTNLVQYPPRLVPVPVKPIFLDLAWNYIEYPGQGKKAGKALGASKSEVRTEAGERVEKTEQGKKKGWFGFGGR